MAFGRAIDSAEVSRVLASRGRWLRVGLTLGHTDVEMAVLKRIGRPSAAARADQNEPDLNAVEADIIIGVDS